MTKPTPVVVVDDEEHVRGACVQALELAGFDPEPYESVEAAAGRLSWSFPGVVVTDVRMPGIDGITFLNTITELDPETPVVLMTGHGDIEMAVDAMRNGAFDFLEKPFDTDRFVDTVSRAAEKRRLVLENRRLRDEVSGRSALENVLLGPSAPMNALRSQIAALADTDADVLILGETGSGKELVARCLHDFSHRTKHPFVAINCGALPETLIESELFGHDAGAFTGAGKKRVGKFEYAVGGSVFLDEIESMPGELQVGLLRVLQERTVEPLGGNRSVPINVRTIAATKVDLLAASNEGRFREDLYYRLNVISVSLPSLRERLEDVPHLFQHFVELSADRHRRPVPDVDPRLTEALMSHEWRGNVRELRNAAERFVLGLPPLEMVDGRSAAPPIASGPLTEQVEHFERHLIDAALKRTGGNVTQACENLSIPRKTFYDKLTKYGLRGEDYRSTG